MPGKGWAALRDRVIRSSVYASVDKDYFSEWAEWKVTHLSAQQRSAYAVVVKGGKVWREGRVLNPQSNYLASSETWFKPLQRFAYVLGFDAAHRITLYVHRHRVGSLHHSTTFAGRPVIDAGMMSIVNGRVVYIEHKSGHYKPELSRMVATLQFLKRAGADLKTIFVSRHVPPPSFIDPVVTPEHFDIVLENGVVALYTAENVLNARQFDFMPRVKVDSNTFFADVTEVSCI
ncbi:hypothetical protein N5D52_21655 [Pseudomonas sp. GD03860]|uniref:hypothetical protein n=1 Tax=Pseudomonas TaxID=286 RepID=UPI002364A2ED|nr:MULTISPECIES: hypothetical protein [Pseudomonas]MDD2058592.1 hypothetical protein [Pseudomonas putida]MDH0639543.1 hypothetical protein [Pseudomonas sp. GD03860]